jgi:hypothetical protein
MAWFPAMSGNLIKSDPTIRRGEFGWQRIQRALPGLMCFEGALLPP